MTNKTKHLLLVVTVPCIIIYYIYRVSVSHTVDVGSILILSLVPHFIAIYFWILISKSPYLWINNYYSKHTKKIESFFNVLTKLTFVLFVILFMSAESILSNYGYKQVEAKHRPFHNSPSYYYRKDTSSSRETKLTKE